mgnify:CR=1 FL=1
MSLFIGFSIEDIKRIFDNIEKFRKKVNEMFSNMFIASFNDDENNGKLMEQWAVFNKKIEQWNKNFFIESYDGFLPVFHYQEMKKQFDELNDLYKETFQALFSNAFLK